MKNATLIRSETSDEGTFGVLTIDPGFRCATGELKWAFNAPGKSCIPFGSFNCKFLWSEKHQCNLYHVQAVPGRTDIEIHPANFCGDKDKGLKCDLLGCIALGKFIGFLDGQKAVCESKDTITRFEALMNGEDFKLEIKWKSTEDGK